MISPMSICTDNKKRSKYIKIFSSYCFREIADIFTFVSVLCFLDFVPWTCTILLNRENGYKKMVSM